MSTCPECNGTRTMDGAADLADMAAWLDCTTCSAQPLDPTERSRARTRLEAIRTALKETPQ